MHHGAAATKNPVLAAVYDLSVTAVMILVPLAPLFLFLRFT